MVSKALRIQIQNVREFLHSRMLVDHHQHYLLLLKILRTPLLVLIMREESRRLIKIKLEIFRAFRIKDKMIVFLLPIGLIA